MALSPLAMHVADSLSGRIHRGELPHGLTLPSERELSVEFATSRIVVRAAIEELERRGLVMRKERCRPVVRAQSLAETPVDGSTRAVGIWLWPEASHYGASQILRGIQRVKADPELRLVIADAVGGDWQSALDSEARFLNAVAEDPQLVGAIVWYLGGVRNRAALEAIRRVGKPVVFVDRRGPGNFDGDFVGTDNRSAAEEAVRHLVGLGHRRIACLTNTDVVSSVRERVEGYQAALAEAGIPFQAEYAAQVKRDDETGVAEALGALCRLPEPPTAIFAINDTIGLQAYDQLKQQGVRIPEQISIVGFDALLRWVPGGGHLTSVKQNFERTGQAAMELLIERIEQGSPAAFRHVLLEAPLSLQGSTGPASTHLEPLRLRRTEVSS